ncbi:protein shisa-5-like [Patiria miniata]|uniref:Uncharacterized protein n=1 Tax=Patiria miniata TaxID=46514 RepID=A0A914AX25_PATMI|nr:protein shisa-5-like [Patiria miniata]
MCSAVEPHTANIMAEFKHRGVFVWSLLLTLLYAANAQLSSLEEAGENFVDNYFHNDVQDTVHDVVSLSVGVIIAIVVGCILLLISCICCCYCCCCRSPPPAQQTVIVAQSAPAQSTVVVAQAPQAVYNPQPMGPPPMQPPVGYGQPQAGYDGPPPYPGQQTGYGYAKL